MIVDAYLDWPAILAPITEVAATLTVNFGASAEAFVAILFGAAEPKGKLPFDIPSSMAAVEASRPDVPFDTAEPTYRFGDGLRFDAWSPAQRPDPASTSIRIATAASRILLDKTLLKTALEDEEAKAIIEELLPRLIELGMAMEMPVGSILGMAGDDVDNAMIEEARTRLAALTPRARPRRIRQI